MSKQQKSKNKKGGAPGGRKNKGGTRQQRGTKRGCDAMDGLPVAAKATHFTASEDDTYCDKLTTLLGPTKRPPWWEVLLVVLGLGPALRGYDKIHYALPMEREDIAQDFKWMQENDWKLPPFNIKEGAVQEEYRFRTEQGWKSYLKRHKGNKKLNKIYVDVSKLATVDWPRIQVLLSSVLSFFRYVWALHPHLFRTHNLDSTNAKTKQQKQRKNGTPQRIYLVDHSVGFCRWLQGCQWLRYASSPPS